MRERGCVLGDWREDSFLLSSPPSHVCLSPLSLPAVHAADLPLQPTPLGQRLWQKGGKSHSPSREGRSPGSRLHPLDVSAWGWGHPKGLAARRPLSGAGSSSDQKSSFPGPGSQPQPLPALQGQPRLPAGPGQGLPAQDPAGAAGAGCQGGGRGVTAAEGRPATLCPLACRSECGPRTCLLATPSPTAAGTGPPAGQSSSCLLPVPNPGPGSKAGPEGTARINAWGTRAAPGHVLGM